MTLYDVLSLVVAASALVLGYVNFRWILLRDRARLHITLRMEALDPLWSPQDHKLNIEIANASFFPITMKELYLSGCFGQQLQKVNFFATDGKNWPFRLEQGDLAEVYLARSNLQRPGENAPNLKWLSGITIELSTGEKIRKRTSMVRNFLGKPTRTT